MCLSYQVVLVDAHGVELLGGATYSVFSLSDVDLMLSFSLAFASDRVHVCITSLTALSWNTDNAIGADQKMLSAAIGPIMVVHELLFVCINLLLSLCFKAGMWTLLLVTSCLLGLLLHSLFVAHDGSIAVHLSRSAVHTLINAEVIHKMDLVMAEVLMLSRLGPCRCRDHFWGEFLIALTIILILNLHLTRTIAATHKVTDLWYVVGCSSTSNFLASDNPSSGILLNLALGGFLVLFPD